ncbi:LysE family translocator [Thalassospira sp. HF15]|uniref:LysE family translocator n=1 Tax=Thalassospira sp. HF15 TaxID=2722755 RepID=UPI0014311450|nr:LysE family translocator [Thalassospira sp. HF15]NIY76928.1 LysE family translocator [Thalassospira sp. HF15]
MTDIGSLATIAVAFFVAAASPGPATLALASVSMGSGRKSGLLFGAGLSVGLGVWGLVAAIGLGSVLQASSHALMILKILGGAYLIWLAWLSACSASRPSKAHRSEPRRISRGFWQGLILNLSNPKAVFAWMAVLSVGLGEGSDAGQVALAAGICVMLGFAIYGFYALMFSTSGAMAVYARARRWIEGAVAGLFALAGFGLIRSAFVRS